MPFLVRAAQELAELPELDQELAELPELAQELAERPLCQNGTPTIA